MASSYKVIDGKPLSDSHAIVRLVGGSFIDDGAKSTETRIKGAAFLSKPKDNGSPSYNWLGFFKGTVEEQIKQVRNIGNLTLPPTAVFAELNVGNIRQKMREEPRKEIREKISNIDIIHKPVAPPEVKNKDDSHCVMTNIPNKPEKGYEPTSLEKAVGRIISRNLMGIYPAQQP